MKNLLFIALLTIVSFQFAAAQKITQIALNSDGKDLFIDFDCRTMSHAPLQRMVSCNEGHLEELTLKINQELVCLNDKGQVISYLPYYLKVEYGTAGELKKITDKNTKLSMKFYYEDAKLTQIRDRGTRSKLCISYNRDGLLSSIIDSRHDVKIKYDYRDGNLSKINSGNAFSVHSFIFKSEQLSKIKQKGQGTLVSFDYQNGRISRMNDRNNPIPMVIR